jgi:hypothetical protein
MRDTIKKILREYDELNWIEEIPSENVVVTQYNVYLGARVRLRKESKYYDARESFNQLGDAVGEIVLNLDDDLLEEEDGYLWVRVTWKAQNGKNKHQDYRVGPKDFDLMFAI